MKTFTTVDLNKQIGTVTEAARKEPVFITHHRKPKFVLMSVDTFQTLIEQRKDPRQSFTLDTMPNDLRDGLLALADSFEPEAGHES